MEPEDFDHLKRETLSQYVFMHSPSLHQNLILKIDKVSSVARTVPEHFCTERGLFWIQPS